MTRTILWTAFATLIVALVAHTILVVNGLPTAPWNDPYRMTPTGMPA